MSSRRDFLGMMACAFAAAALPCRIPKSAIVEERAALGHYGAVAWKTYFAMTTLNAEWVQVAA